MSMTSMMAKTIKVAIAANNTAPMTGIDAIISPTVSANRIDKIKIMTSIQHLFFLCLQPV